jgi:hypothetical protein
MIARIITVNSTRPTIFARRRRLADQAQAVGKDRRHLMVTAGLAVLALVVGGLSARLGLAAFHAQEGRGALLAAGTTMDPAARDEALATAQSALKRSVATASDNPRVWDLLGETYYLQATQAAVGDVSPTLLGAAAEASAKAGATPAAVTRLAVVLSFDPERAGEAADALTRSFNLAPVLSAPGERRVLAASRVWSLLGPSVQQAVLAETCAGGRTSAEAASRLKEIAARARDPGFTIAAETTLVRPECQPGV